MRPTDASRYHDWPDTLPAAHGRIDAYRYALEAVELALLGARPFVEEATEASAPIRSVIGDAIRLAAAELTVFTHEHTKGEV